MSRSLLLVLGPLPLLSPGRRCGRRPSGGCAERDRSSRAREGGAERQALDRPARARRAGGPPPRPEPGDDAAGLRDKKAYRGAAATDSLSGAGEVYVYVSLADGSPTSLVDPFATGRQPRRGARTRRGVDRLGPPARARLAAVRPVHPDRAARAGRRRLGHDRGRRPAEGGPLPGPVPGAPAPG